MVCNVTAFFFYHTLSLEMSSRENWLNPVWIFFCVWYLFRSGFRGHSFSSFWLWSWSSWSSISRLLDLWWVKWATLALKPSFKEWRETKKKRRQRNWRKDRSVELKSIRKHCNNANPYVVQREAKHPIAVAIKSFFIQNSAQREEEIVIQAYPMSLVTTCFVSTSFRRPEILFLSETLFLLVNWFILQLRNHAFRDRKIWLPKINIVEVLLHQKKDSCWHLDSECKGKKRLLLLVSDLMTRMDKRMMKAFSKAN